MIAIISRFIQSPYSICSVLIAMALGMSAQQPSTHFELNPQIFGHNQLDQFPVELFIQQDYLRDSTYTYRKGANSTQEEWDLRERMRYHYNSNGLVEKIEHAKQVAQVWELERVEQFMYRPDGLILEHAELKIDDYAGQLVNHRQTSFSYTYFGEVAEVYISEWHVNEWRPLERVVSSFDEAYVITQQVSYTWNASTEEWRPFVMITYIYDNNLLTEEHTLIWDERSATWSHNGTRTYTTSNGLSASEVHAAWSESEGDFVPTLITLTEYNELGQPISIDHAPLGNEGVDDEGLQLSANYSDKGQLEESILSVWDEETETWIPESREVHYWSKHLRGKPSPLNRDIACTFANPYTIGLPWHCDNLNNEITYTVTVLDLMGRVYHTGSFKGGQTFRVRTAIPPGFYVVQIAGGLDLHAEKILVR